jgi:aldehyde:ferredoxin oxidoreductase
LRPADHLVGKVTGEVDALLKQELGDEKIEILQHGPAAERGVLFSSLVNMSNRNNGRTGMGLVMASKNLRAIAVRGTWKVAIADPQALARLHRLGPKELPNNPDMDGLAKYGTASVVMPQHTMGTLPTRNYNEGQFEGAEAISGERMYDAILKDRDTCYACVVRCKRVVEIKDGRYTVDPVLRRPGIRDPEHLWLLLRRGRSGCHRTRQSNLQHVRRGHHLLRRHHRIRNGMLRKRHHREGRDRGD